MSKISTMYLPEFGYAEHMMAIVGNITEIFEELFGEGIVLNAWVIMGFQDNRPGRFIEHDYNKSYFESLLKKKEEYYSVHHRFFVDDDDVIIEFVTGNKICIQADDWCSFNKPKELD